MWGLPMSPRLSSVFGNVGDAGKSSYLRFTASPHRAERNALLLSSLPIALPPILPRFSHHLRGRTFSGGEKFHIMESGMVGVLNFLP